MPRRISNYIININDSGALNSGNNTLMINGAATNAGQTFLIRDLFVAIVQSDGSPAYQRINYNDTITDRLIINGGDINGVNPLNGSGNLTGAGNHFYLDGNSSVMTLNAGDGQDTFQVGQVYSSAAINGPAAGDPQLGTQGLGSGLVGGVFVDALHTTLTTVGYLSDGVNKATTIYGGSGTDTFQVYSNKADLSLIGGSGDDTFIVRAFLVAAGTHIGVQGGSQNNIIQYNINAPVDIIGGTGFNTLVLIGTEAGDVFVVTDHGIFGGGLNVSYTNIQAVTIDTLEGDDTIYVLSTPQNVVTTVNAGDGGDVIDVGGNVTGAVISANTKGATSATDNTVSSNDSRYDTLFVDGISVSVGGSNQIIGQDARTVIHENDPTSIASFTISAPTLAVGQTAYVNVSPTTASAEWTSQGAKGLEVSLDGIHWAANLTIAFTNTAGVITANGVNFDPANPPKVFLRAVANNTYPLNETITVAGTIIALTGGISTPSDQALDDLILPTVKVFLETSATGLIIDQGIASTTITAGSDPSERIVYSYQLSLNKQPAPGEVITVALNATAGAGLVLSTSVVTFNASNYNQPQTINVYSTLDSNAQPGHDAIPVTIQQVLTSSLTPTVHTDAGDVNLTIAATNTPGVLLIEPQGEASVNAAQTYTYQMVLTAPPVNSDPNDPNRLTDGTVTVNILGDGLTYGTSAASGFNDVVFNAAGSNPYYTILSVSADHKTVTLKGTPPITAESAILDIAPVTINVQNESTASATSSAQVAFDNTAHSMTLTSGESWTSLGYKVGQGVFIGSQSGDLNANGTDFNASAATYYTIASINGSVLTVNGTLHNETATVDIASVKINIVNTSTADTLQSHDLTFATNGVTSTITLTNGTWDGTGGLGYSVGGGIFVGSTTDKNGNTFNQSYTFTAADWNKPVSITLHANPNADFSNSGSNAIANNINTPIPFPDQQHILSGIKGPLIIDGGTEAGQPTLVAAIALPYEYNPSVPQPQPNPGTTTNVDILRIFDDGNTVGQNGYLTTVPSGENPLIVNADNIHGLDIPNLVDGTVGSISVSNNKLTNLSTGAIYEGGITYFNMDTVDLFLGAGDDTFTINTTVPTVNADDGFGTMTMIEGGGGSNTITVTASSDPLVLYGNESGNGDYDSVSTANGRTNKDDPYFFTNFGSNTIDASGATGAVVIVGGPNSDTLTGGSGTNWIAGGEGADIITETAPAVANYIFGNSSFTVDPQHRLMTINNNLLPMDNGVLSAGGDIIDVAGSGTSIVIGDYGTVSILGHVAGIVDPFSILGPQTIVSIASANTSLGGNDQITVGNNDIVIGGAGDDRIILGSGGQNVTIGDNGEIDYTKNATTGVNVLTSIESTDAAHGGDDTISGQWVSGIPTNVSFGDVNGLGTITLTGGGSWAALGYAINEGVYVQGTGVNGKGDTFTGGNYYTITSVVGAVLTLNVGVTAAASATVNLSPVTINTQTPAQSSLGTIPTAVTFGNSGGAGTISLTNGGNWESLGYIVGEGIYVQGASGNGNGATFDPTAVNAYYTIAADQRGDAHLAERPAVPKHRCRNG